MEDNSDSSDKQTHRRCKKIKANDAIGTLRSGETTARHIPQEIIEEILVRLPVKSLLRFKCVAKSWLALTSTSKFITTHLTYSTNLDQTLSNYRLMLNISYDRYGHNESNCLNSFVLRDFWTGVVDGADRPNDQTKHRFTIHSSCNGLLCVALYYRSRLKDVFLWNPCLRMSKKLPPTLCAAEGSCAIWMPRYCIAYDERNDDYKVVALSSLGSPLESNKVEIYSLKNDSWKRIEDFKGDCYRRTFMVYASGKINFAQYCKRGYLSIVSLDLESEVYGTVELNLKIEQKKEYSYLSVGALKGCICALHSHAQDRNDVWILKEYGVEESWTKLVSIPYVNGPPSVYNHYQYHLLFMWNGKYLLGHRSHLVVYDPEDSSFVHHSFINGIMDYIGSGRIYVESLVPLPEMKSFAPLPDQIKL